VTTRREARIARVLAQELKAEAKSARLVERVAAEQPQTRTVRFGANPDSIFQMQMAWEISSADRADSWSWGERDWSDVDWARLIEPKLSSYAQLTWAEIDTHSTDTGHKAHHNMGVETICGEAQTRIEALELQHDGDIFRFRLGNKRRLWGFRIINVFGVLWFDPLHQIYPTDPD
jgi:hypothetical protein